MIIDKKLIAIKDALMVNIHFNRNIEIDASDELIKEILEYDFCILGYCWNKNYREGVCRKCWNEMHD